MNNSTENSKVLTGKDPAESAVAKIIEWSISNQLIVLILCTALAITGWMALQRTPLDAVPDLTDTQVIIRTDFPGQSPQIVEVSIVHQPTWSTQNKRCTRCVDVWDQFCLCDF